MDHAEETTSSPSTSTASCFIEIDGPQSEEEEALPEWIECYVIVNIDPKNCGSLARDLNAVLPLRIPTTSRASTDTPLPPPSVADEPGNDGIFPKTDHLKRIRRRPATTDEINSRSRSETIQEQSTNNNDNAAVTQDGEKSSTNGNENNGLKPTTKDSTDEHPSKRSKTNKKSKQQNSSPHSLDILVGSVAAVDRSIEAAGQKSTLSLSYILEKYNISPQSPNFTRCSLPGRPAHTRDELNQWNKSIWHTLFFEKKTEKYKDEQLALTQEEVKMMKKGMNEALKDACSGQQQSKEWTSTINNNEEETGVIPPIAGVVVMNPLNGSVVSRASKERQIQGMPENNSADGTKSNTQNGKSQSTKNPTWSSFPDEANPLCTPTFLAIQGVSRRERHIALGCGMESDEFRTGQYLCTGYDVYLTKEPNVYEAMALVHSRVRRVVFGVRDKDMGGLGGAANAANRQNTGIHSLPGTNHHYRVFRLDMESDEVCGEMAALVESLRGLQ